MDRWSHQLLYLPFCWSSVRAWSFSLDSALWTLYPKQSLTSSGAFITDPLNHYLGRRGEIFLTAACLTATPIASGFARTWQELLIIRCIMGVGIGAKNATVPIFSAELAPARIRGALVMFWQLWVVAGGSNLCKSVGFWLTPQVSSSVSAPTSLSKTPATSPGVFSSVPHSSPLSSSCAVSGSRRNPPDGS